MKRNLQWKHEWLEFSNPKSNTRLSLRTNGVVRRFFIDRSAMYPARYKRR